METKQHKIRYIIQGQKHIYKNYAVHNFPVMEHNLPSFSNILLL